MMEYYHENESQNYLVFQPFSRYFTFENEKSGSWQLKEISAQSITPPSTTDKSFDL